MLLFWTENDLDDLEKALNLLSAPDLKSFAKTYHLTSTANKKEIIPSLLKKCTGNTIGSMFKVSGHDPRQAMLKRFVKWKQYGKQYDNYKVRTVKHGHSKHAYNEFNDMFTVNLTSFSLVYKLIMNFFVK